MPYTVTQSEIPDVLILEPKVHGDTRGFFVETFNQREFAVATGLEVNFVQDNHSRSRRGVLRGLHYQLAPCAQGKLVRVARGAIFDVAVDIRPDSITYGRWVGVRLDDVQHRQLWIPPGFAHGFLALSEEVDVIYKVTEYYSPQHERSIRWDDPAIAIQWPLDGMSPILSEKDAAGMPLDNL